MNTTSFKVEVNVYDLSQGMAKQFSPMFLGKQIDGVWHTGLVCYGKEYFFGGGIQHGVPRQTQFGSPTNTIDHGVTEIPQAVFEDFLLTIKDKYNMQTYDLFKNNCNNFTNECSDFLLGKGIPAHITGLPNEVLDTPFGQMIKPMIEQFTNQAMNGGNSQPQFSAPQAQSNDQQQQLVNQLAGLMSMNGGFNMNGGANMSGSTSMSGSTTSTGVNMSMSGGAQPQQQPQVPQQPTNVIPIEDLEMFLICTESSPQCVIDFYADWCGPCKIIKPTFNELSNSNEDVQFYEVNIDNAKEIAQQLGVNSIPTFITYKNGQLVEKWTGGNVATLREKIQALKK